MQKIIFFFTFFLATPSFAVLEYSKIEYSGCPENAYCQKNTGEVRSQWLKSLDEFNRDKISETKFNADLQNHFGLPMAGWAMEEAGVLPRIMMWDSPCKQHKREASKFYISDFFRKNLKESELKEFTTIYYPRAVVSDNNKNVYSMIVPRGDIPTFIDNDYLHYLKEDDGKYYALLLNREGEIRVTKPQIVKELPRDGVCTKEQVDLFLREAPSPTFYESHYCKEIWNKKTKAYNTILFGRSCN